MTTTTTTTVRLVIAITVAVLSFSTLSLAERRQFLVLCDLHYDPAYPQFPPHSCSHPEASPLGKFGCDSPKSLILSALDEAKRRLPNPDFVLLLGDSVRHEVPDGNATGWSIEIMADVTQWLEARFPNATVPHILEGRNISDIIDTIGNNDVQPDYDLPVVANSSALASLATSWQSMLEAQEAADLRRGGYFVRHLQPVSIISINTIVYSAQHTPTDNRVPDPFDQFAWLERQLKNLSDANGSAYIVGHIPPVMDTCE